MLTYDGQTTDERQTSDEGLTASNEDPIEIQVEDDDVDLVLFQEKQNKEDEKVPSEQNNGDRRKYHGEQSPEEKILSEQNRERERKKRRRRRWDRSIEGEIDLIL
jgi:hypothetical protein